MIHNRVSDDLSGDHWGVNIAKGALGMPNRVLAQLQHGDDYARLALTPEQAEDMAHALLVNAQRAREAKNDNDETFEPSLELVDLVLQGVRDRLEPDEVEPMRKSFTTHLTNALLGLLNTMAGSLRYSKQAAPYPIATEQAGIDHRLHKAIFARVVVAPERQADFLSLLAKELYAAAAECRVWGPYWYLRKNEKGELDLFLWPEPLRPADWPQERAKPVMLGFGRRAARP